MIVWVGRLLRSLLPKSHARGRASAVEVGVRRRNDWGHGIRFRDTQPTARPAFADTRPADGLASSGWLMSSMDLVNGVEIVDSEGDDWAITQQGHLHDGSHCARDGVDAASTIPSRSSRT